MKHFKLVDRAVNNILMQANSDEINDVWERVRSIFNYSVPMYIFDNKTLEHIIDIAPDWEFCEIHGFLDELSERTNSFFINNEGEFDDTLVYETLKGFKKEFNND